MKNKYSIFIFCMCILLFSAFVSASSLSSLNPSPSELTKTGFFGKVFSSITGGVIDEGNGIERSGNLLSKHLNINKLFIYINSEFNYETE